MICGEYYKRALFALLYFIAKLPPTPPLRANPTNLSLNESWQKKERKARPFCTVLGKKSLRFPEVRTPLPSFFFFFETQTRSEFAPCFVGGSRPKKEGRLRLLWGPKIAAQPPTPKTKKMSVCGVSSLPPRFFERRRFFASFEAPFPFLSFAPRLCYFP